MPLAAALPLLRPTALLDRCIPDPFAFVLTPPFLCRNILLFICNVTVVRSPGPKIRVPIEHARLKLTCERASERSVWRE